MQDPVATFSIPGKPQTREVAFWRVGGQCGRAAALLLLVATAPVQVTIGVIITLLSRRSPLIAHKRVGQDGSTLWVLKLRTMWDADEPESRSWIKFVDDGKGPQQKSASDVRVNSRFARFCRRHSFDELPQLWQVVRGEMALIGPRPLTCAEIDEHYADVVDELLSVKPGIAGLWQTSGRSRLTYRERRELDLLFVRRRSAAMYVRILARLVPAIVFGAGAW